MSLVQNRLNVETICGNVALAGDGLLRFGHAHVLTSHCDVIHYARAASLRPRRPVKHHIIAFVLKIRRFKHTNKIK